MSHDESPTDPPGADEIAGEPSLTESPDQPDSMEEADLVNGEEPPRRGESDHETGEEQAAKNRADESPA